MTATFRYHAFTIMWLSLTALCGVVLTLGGIYLYLDPQIPKAESYRTVTFETPLRIYSADAKLLAEFGERRSIPVKLQDIPKPFIQALLDTEDKRFYEHRGIDFISLVNDTLELLLNREIRSGASTITMQLSRNVSFSLEQTFIRKFKEMLLALKIEQALSKDEILELYINGVPYGKRAYGAQAAAFTYYGKPLNELSLAQLAMLAGIPQAPSAGNPINGPKRAIRRRNTVLSRMLDQGSIDQATYDNAVAEPITAQIYQRELDTPAPFVAEWVRAQLFGKYPDLYTGGYEVYTTIKADWQASATQSLRKGLAAYDLQHGYRGPEDNLITGNTESDESDDQPDETQQPIADLQEMAVERLRETPIVGDLNPAVVLAVDDNQAVALHKNGDTIRIPMRGLIWAKPYEEVNIQGPEPQTPQDVLHTGDLIRVIQEELTPEELAQIESAEADADAVADKATNSQDSPIWALRQVPEVQGALVSMDPDTGAVYALEGGYDFGLNQFNHALQAARQPGSSFKPFVYSAALANGVTPASVFMDAPLVFDDDALEMQYRPGNDNRRYNGPTRLREALYRSINLVSIRVMLDIGANAVLKHVRGFGFNTKSFPRNTQLAIGGGTMAVTPMQAATAFSVFANGGYRPTPYVVDRVVSPGGEVLQQTKPERICEPCDQQQDPANLPEHCALLTAQIDGDNTANANETITDDEGAQKGLIDRSPPEPTYTCAPRVLEERNAFIMNTMLQDVIQRGTGRRARVLERSDIGGKTGTTNDAADTWFNGFSRDLVTSVWVGFSDFDPLGAKAYGSNTPLPIWVDYMNSTLADVPARELSQPPGVVVAKINEETGEAASPGAPNTIFEYFYSENAPKIAPGTRLQPVGESPDEVKAIDLF